MVPPGLSRPSRSAASTIATAGRAFTDPPGFVVSILAMRSHVSPRPMRESRTSGVSPMRSRTESATSISPAIVRDGSPPRRRLNALQEHSFSIDVDASPDEVWEGFWYRRNDRPKNNTGTVDIRPPGAAAGSGATGVEAASGGGAGRSDQPWRGGWMFWFRWNKLSGSYFALAFERRS